MKKLLLIIVILLITPIALFAAGQQEVDAVTTASVVDNASDFLSAVSQDGTWIAAVLQDLSLDEEIVISGQFIHNDEPYRKLAFYAQDENRTVTDRFTVTAPRMLVQSENTRIQGGTFAGDVYVEANGFHLVDGTVDGNIYFSSQEYLNSFSLDDGSTVTGKTELQ
ncbi:MAG: hypothetical protein K9L24_00830 [Spirochaetia bacterium]|nr:hypothetical protein [Spirochaetia bacterium]MCF7945385.1 hypothetical protein [Spirochaetia bacterium]MCF7954076.1 hypothetical protein [Spirochaetales bacterium]